MHKVPKMLNLKLELRKSMYLMHITSISWKIVHFIRTQDRFNDTDITLNHTNTNINKYI